MITATLTYNMITTQQDFTSLTSALEYARSQEVGTTYRITEGKTLLAKGKIEDLKDKFYA
jgi:hypothetical protein